MYAENHSVFISQLQFSCASFMFLQFLSELCIKHTEDAFDTILKDNQG